MIKRNGVIVGTTTNLNFTDLLPDFGEYCYTVQAVYDEGQTSPAGPECIEWPNPTIFINPMNLEGWVWVNNQVKVYTTITNTGIGTLHYTFPDFAVSDNLSAGNTIDLPAGPTSAPQNTAVATGVQGTPGKHLYSGSWQRRTCRDQRITGVLRILAPTSTTS